MSSKIIAECEALLPAGTTVNFAWTAQTGLKPTWRLLTSWLLILNKSRIVAVTDSRIYVFSARWSPFTRSHPKRLVQDVARAEAELPPKLRSSWTRFRFGRERMWVGRGAYRTVSQAFGLS